MMASLNWVDTVILVVFLLSILAGLMRGLVKEMIALLTWAAAFTVGILFSPTLANFFHSKTADSTAPSAVSLGTSFIILFIATVIIGTLINYFASRAVEMGGISFSNRLLGAVFGLARGFLLVIFAIYLAQMTSLADKPYWDESQFVHSFQPAVQWINQSLGSDIENIKSKMGDTLKNVEIQNTETQHTKESTK